MELAYQQSLIQAGFTKDQAAVYEALARSGPSHASDAARSAGLGRPLTYKILDELIAMGLVEKKDESGKVATFTPAHPLKLKEVVEKKLEAAKDAEVALDGVLGKLTSDFNLQSGKPGVRFFEGRDGIAECLNDALTSKTEIYSYVDIAEVEREIPDISREFAKRRQKLGLKKKNIGVDTPENRQEIEGYYTDVTEERLVPWKTTSFGTVMQIYDGKVSYFTLASPSKASAEGGHQMIGVIIADPHIYEMHRSLFEHTWSDPRAYIPAKTHSAASAKLDAS